MVGENPASQIYVRNKIKACQEVGFLSFDHTLPHSTTENELLRLIDSLNENPKVHGILLQLPLPPGFDTQKIMERIAPKKDADGFHPVNVGRLVLGLPGPKPCTPAGIMALLESIPFSPAGKQAVVVGRSNIVGKPVALMLTQANATVTVCHSQTKNLPDILKQADLVVTAIGKPKFIQGDWLKKGAVVIDVGMNRLSNGKLAGDCDFDSAAKIAKAITPVPGGVGPMTIAMLLQNTLTLAKESTHA